MANKNTNNEQVILDDLEDATGAATELPAQDRARLALAAWVLGSVAILFIASCFVLIYGPEERLEQAKAVFDFVKTIGPPIATLVIGFYFRNEGD